MNQNPKVSYSTIDLLGSPRVITDENRQILSRRDMTPFGEEISAGVGSRSEGQKFSASDSVRMKFTGQQRDETVKLDYFNARHYAFSLGRFMSADNFGGKLSNPQTFNLYAYALNNPLKWVDPTGHFPDDPPCPLCKVNKDNQLLDGKNPYVLTTEYVTVTGNERTELKDSLWDFVPFAGPLRQMAFNMNCHGGG